MVEKQKEKIRFIGWIFICTFAFIFGIWTDRYSLSIVFVVVLVIKYFEMKYPELLG